MRRANALIVGENDVADECATALRGAGMSVTHLHPSRFTNDSTAAIAAAEAAAGRVLGLLVNVLGGAVVGPFDTLTLEDWAKQIHAGMTVPFLTCKHAVTHMRRGGLIVNVSSLAGREPYPQWASYVAARHGLLGFSTTIREELRPRGIGVSIIEPGATAGLLEFGEPEIWDNDRILSPTDIAAVLTKLAAGRVDVVVENVFFRHVTGRL